MGTDSDGKDDEDVDDDEDEDEDGDESGDDDDTDDGGLSTAKSLRVLLFASVFPSFPTNLSVLLLWSPLPLPLPPPRPPPPPPVLEFLLFVLLRLGKVINDDKVSLRWASSSFGCNAATAAAA
jgi:hypothetical protein